MKAVISTITKFFNDADILLLALSVISTVYGIILISSVTRTMEGRFVSVQIGAAVFGVALFVLFSYLDIDIMADKSRLLFVLSLLFISTLLIWGQGDYVGRRAWLRFWDIGIQPAEIVKVPFIIVMAKMMVNYKERKTLNSILSILKLGVVFAIVFVFVLEVSQDMGTALVYMGIFVVMLFVAGLKLRWFIIAGAAVAAVFPFLLDNVFAYHQRARILAPFFPDMLTQESLERYTWQSNLSVTAIASGEFLGQGLGNGRLTQGDFPAQHTDFIFSAAGEELGFVGCMLIVILLVAMIIRCVYVGAKSNNPLGLLVCTGVAGMLISQTVENIGMALGLMPVIGITLPFFSYGGSSIVTCFAAMGIVSGIKMRPKPVRFRNL